VVGPCVRAIAAVDFHIPFILLSCKRYKLDIKANYFRLPMNAFNASHFVYA